MRSTDETGKPSPGKPVEGRHARSMEPLEEKMPEHRTRSSVSIKLQRIAALAREIHAPLRTLAHHIDIDWLLEAHARTRKDAAPGVDGQTAEEYAKDLEGNLRRLLDRAKSGTYRAPPVRRVEIQKGSGKETRPIGIPTFEDKVLQRAIAMALEGVYEQEFNDCSYGFRPGRSAHQALEVLREAIMDMGGGWVVEIDIRRFFDTLDHGRLREFLRQRVHDGVILRLIGKWLKAGVLEEGSVRHPHMGTPQGGVISPLLANVYLHEVLDQWFARVVRPRLYGRAHLIRYADDVVVVFALQADAERVLRALPARFGAFGLTLHPEKTRLVPFGRPPRKQDDSAPPQGPGSFDFLGFTHFWALSRKSHWVVKSKTARDRFTRAVRAAREWCRRNRHLPVADQHRTLCQKMRGHFGYYGVTGNSQALSRFRHEVLGIWRYWLSRRSQRAYLSWERFRRLQQRYPLPPARAVHSIYVT